MSLADVWLIHLGQWLTDTRQRTLLEARHKHDYSLFRYLYLIHIRGEIAAPDEVLLSLLFSGST